MQWLSLLGPVVVAMALLILPGLVIALAARQRGFAALAMAAPLSISAMAVAALASGLLGTGWSWMALAAAAALIAIVAGAVAWSVHRWTKTRPARSENPVDRGSLRTDAPFWVGLAVGSMLLVRHMKNILDRPDAFSQTFDNIFHLSAIRFIADTGFASPFEVGRMTAAPGEVTSFYPTGFHDAASLVMRAFPDTVTLPTNGLLVVVVALIWPASCLLLTRSLLRPSWPVAVATGVLAASFSAFPILLLDFGVLYPNLLGLALLPAPLGLAVQGLRLGATQWVAPWLAWCLFLASLPGLILAHPNTVMTLTAVLIPMVLVFAFRRIVAVRDKSASVVSLVATLVGTTLFLIAVNSLWRVVRPDEAAATWPPLMTVPQAFGEALLNAPAGAHAIWVPSLLVVVGLVSARRERTGGLALGWVVLVFLWLVVSAWEPSPLRTFYTGIWYNDPWRFAAVLPLVTVPLAALGVSVIWRVCATRLPATAVVTALATMVIAAALVLTTQRVTYMNNAVDMASRNYELGPKSVLVSSDEYAVILKAAEIVPPGAVIATNPWNGSSMAWALAGLRTTTTHVFYTETPDLRTVTHRLDEAATAPEICPAIKRLGVQYALDFGDQEVHGGLHLTPGFDSLYRAEGFELVFRQGNAALYHMTACA